MTLTAALYSSLSGLRAAQGGMDVLARNVANAGTPGYTRKSSAQESIVLDGQGAGVRRAEIERAIDQRVQRELRTERGESARLSVVDEFRQRVDAMFGRPDEEFSFAASVNRLTLSFQTLADKPESPTLRADAISSADSLARDLNHMTDQIQSMRLEADQGLVDGVREINDALNNIQTLNQKITVRNQTGRSYADLADQRDQYIDTIADYMDISYFDRGNGEVVILTGSGRPLLDVTVRELRVDGRTVITPQSLYNADPSLRGVSTVSLITEDGAIDLLANNEIRGGRLAGLIELRDETLPQLQNQLDEFAHQLATTLSVGEVTAGDTVSVTTTTAGEFNGLGVGDYDPFAGDQADVTLDFSLDGTAVSVANFAIDATSTTTIADSIQQALDLAGQTDITVSVTGTGAADYAITFTDDQGRKLDGVTLTENGSGDTISPAVDDPYQSTVLDVSSVLTAGDTVVVHYAATGTSDTQTVTLTAVDPPGTGEPNTFLIATTNEATTTNIRVALETAFTSLAPGGFTVIEDKANGTIEIRDVINPSSQELRGMSATTRGAADLQLTLFADNSGADQIAYTGPQPGETDDQRLGFAGRISVNESVRNDPDSLVRYLLDPATGELAPDGDSARPAEMVRRLSDMIMDFDSVDGMGTVSTTIEGLAIEILSFQATKTAQAGDELAYQEHVTDNVHRRFDAVSGVNIDDEMTQLLLLEHSYAASSQVLQAVQQMLDDLLNAIR